MHKGYFDGACSPNPGELGLGACINDNNGKEVASFHCYRKFGTHNESEYLSLILLLSRAVKLGIKELECYGDSNLIINHVTGKFKPGQKFLPYLGKIKELTQHFSFVSFTWIPREQNKRADELSKLGLDSKSEAITANGFHTSAQRPNQVSKAKVKQVEQPSKTVVNKRNTGFRVNHLGDGRLLIEHGHNSSVVDLLKHTCSCESYRNNKDCSHINAVTKILPIFRIKKTAEQVIFEKSV